VTWGNFLADKRDPNARFDVNKEIWNGAGQFTYG